MAGWTTLRELLRMEIKQRGEEGCKISGFAEKLERARDDAALNALYDELMTLPIEADFPFAEPETLAGIRATRQGESAMPSSSAAREACGV